MYEVILVLDPSALIPCGDKPEEDKRAVRKLGNTLKAQPWISVYLSHYLVKIYQTKVAPQLKGHHPLPYFQAGLLRGLYRLREISSSSRGRLCKTFLTDMGVSLHILEYTRVQHYYVEDIGLREPDDKEVLRTALAATRYAAETFLVATDSHFFEDLNRNGLSRRYLHESQRLRIVKPDDRTLVKLLASA